MKIFKKKIAITLIVSLLFSNTLFAGLKLTEPNDEFIAFNIIFTDNTSTSKNGYQVEFGDEFGHDFIRNNSNGIKTLSDGLKLELKQKHLNNDTIKLIYKLTNLSNKKMKERHIYTRKCVDGFLGLIPGKFEQSNEKPCNLYLQNKEKGKNLNILLINNKNVTNVNYVENLKLLDPNSTEKFGYTTYGWRGISLEPNETKEFSVIIEGGDIDNDIPTIDTILLTNKIV